MSESEQARLLRQRVENANPEATAAAAAARFERNAIPVPGELIAPTNAPTWQRRVYADARRLYRELVIAEPDGLTLIELRAAGYLGHEPHKLALELLRKSGVVVEGSHPSGTWPEDRTFFRPVAKQ